MSIGLLDINPSVYHSIVLCLFPPLPAGRHKCRRAPLFYLRAAAGAAAGKGWFLLAVHAQSVPAEMSIIQAVCSLLYIHNHHWVTVPFTSLRGSKKSLGMAGFC